MVLLGLGVGLDCAVCVSAAANLEDVDYVVPTGLRRGVRVQGNGLGNGGELAIRRMSGRSFLRRLSGQQLERTHFVCVEQERWFLLAKEKWAEPTPRILSEAASV